MDLLELRRERVLLPRCVLVDRNLPSSCVLEWIARRAIRFVVSHPSHSLSLVHKHNTRGRYVHNVVDELNGIRRREVLTNQLGQRHELRARHAEHSLEVGVKVDDAAVVGVLQTIAANVLPQGDEDARPRVGVHAQRTLQLLREAVARWRVREVHKMRACTGVSPVRVISKPSDSVTD